MKAKLLRRDRRCFYPKIPQPKSFDGAKEKVPVETFSLTFLAGSERFTAYMLV
jgi:hypothetical protein